jgi:hypothetical protein
LLGRFDVALSPIKAQKFASHANGIKDDERCVSEMMKKI